MKRKIKFLAILMFVTMLFASPFVYTVVRSNISHVSNTDSDYSKSLHTNQADKSIIHGHDDSNDNETDDGNNVGDDPDNGDGDAGDEPGDGNGVGDEPSDNETDNGHDIDDEDDYEEEMPLDYKVGDDEIEIISADNQIQFSTDKPEFKFEYENETTELSFQFNLKDIIEFNDSNGNLIIDDGETLQVIKLHDLPVNVTFMNVTDPQLNTTIYYIRYHFTSDSGINVTIEFTVSQKSIGLLSGGADGVKYTIRIDGWPWLSNESYLGTVTSIEYEFEYENETTLYNETTSANQTLQIGYLYVNNTLIMIGWNLDIIKDGSNATLLNFYTEKYENETEYDDEEFETEVEMRFITVYPHFNRSMYHDPIVTVIDEPEKEAAILDNLQLTNVQSQNIPQLNLTTTQIIAIGIFATIIIAAATIIKRKNEF